MNTATPTAPLIASLQRRIATRREQARAERDEYEALSASLLVRPDDDALLAKESDLASRIAANASVLSLLETQLDEANEREETTRSATLQANGRRKLQAVVEKHAARTDDYAAVDAAANQLVHALRALHENGEALGREVQQLSVDLFAGRSNDGLMRLLPAASGTAGADVAAIATVIKSIVDEFGAGRLSEHVEVNSFFTATTLLEAHRINGRTLASGLL